MKRPLICLLSISVLIGADAHAWGKKKKGIISRATGALLQPRPTAPQQIAPRQKSSILVPIAAGAVAGAVAGSVVADDDEKTVVVVPVPLPVAYARTDAAYVMDLPSPTAGKVRRLKMSEPLTIHETLGEWARISAPGATEEWVMRAHLSTNVP